MHNSATKAASSTPRPAVAADAPAITDCVHAAYRHYIARMGKPPGPMLADYAEVIEKHSVFAVDADWLAGDDYAARGVIGVLVLHETPEEILLDNVAVHPCCQGRGIGRHLLQFAEAEARRRGHSELQLYTHECMHENIALYKRIGYVETARKVVRGYARVYMKKELGFL